MLEDLDLSSIADERARELVQQLLNGLEEVMAALRAAQAENQRLRDEINRLKGEQGTPSDQAQHSATASQAVLLGKERRQPKIWSKGRKTPRSCHRPRPGGAGRSDPLAAGCRVQGLRGRGGPGRALPHRQCPLPQREILLPLPAPDLPGRPAARLQRPVWSWDQASRPGVCLRGPDERAQMAELCGVWASRSRTGRCPTS